MAAFCLTKQATEKLKLALKSRELDPFKMADMTSAERRDLLTKHIGSENAKEVNALFESKLLLKNKQQGYINWAKKVTGITTEAKRDIISRIERMQDVLDPKQEQKFLEDLAAKRLGLEITEVEAKNLADFYKKVDELQTKRDSNTLEFLNEKDRLDFGAAKINLLNYFNGLKNDTTKLSLTERLKPENYIKNTSEIAGIAKSVKASLDNSAIFRQGWKTLWTNPGIWLKNASKTFVDFVKTIKDKEKVKDGIMADIVSRSNYDRMVKAKLAVGNIEEAFPTSLPEKLPLIGRLFKASQTAFEGFVYRQRADIFDKYIEIMKRSELNIDDPKELLGIGKVINSLTGRADLGKFEPSADVINNIFFSPRFLKSHIDVLTAHSLDKNLTPFARKEAAKNLTKVILGTAAVLTIAKALNPDSVEEDPRSSDFGKIKIGNTRFDVSGGMASVITLAARLISMSSKSSTTGKVSPLNSGGFGSSTGTDVVYNFFENKLSPAAAIIKDLLKGEDFQGNKPTIIGELNNLLMPLPISNFIELKDDPNSAPILLAMMADALGIGTNTYGKSTTDWNKSDSVELTQFKTKVGEEKFKKANEKFNKLLDEWSQKTYRDSKYQNLSDDGKQKVIEGAKKEIKEKVFKEYHFRAKKNQSTSSEKQEKRIIKNLLP
jgi:hypothetical protein